MKLNLKRSEVTLGDRRFPACALICPPDDVGGTDWDRSLGGMEVPGYPYAYVPGENGILVEIAQEPDSRSYAVHLYSRTCEHAETPSGEWTWLPQALSIVQNRIGVHKDSRGLIQGAWHWDRADEWWVVEHIDRVTQLPYDEPPGPRVQLVRLGDSPERIG